MSPSSLHIVLSDDDKDDCFLFSEIIVELPFSIDLTIVHDGEELMNRLNNDSFNPPDMLFLDLNMPRKNGFEVMDEIKSSEHLKDLPVVIYSTSFNRKTIDLLYGKGAYYYLRKPTDFIRLRNILHQIISKISGNSFSKPPREKFVLLK